MEGDKEVAEKAQRKKMKRGQSEVERERERGGTVKTKDICNGGTVGG